MPNEWHGYTGKILRIDLSRRTVKTQELRKEDAVRFIGGVGLAAKIIHDEVGAEVSPYDPDNLLV
ncbi:hypothetical protein DRO55_05870, partial [Candidatus Bathyarchaeota archaeon]